MVLASFSDISSFCRKYDGYTVSFCSIGSSVSGFCSGGDIFLLQTGAKIYHQMAAQGTDFSDISDSGYIYAFDAGIQKLPVYDIVHVLCDGDMLYVTARYG